MIDDALVSPSAECRRLRSLELPPPEPGQSSRWPPRLQRGLGAYALIGGLVSLLGWVFDIPALTDWIGDGISIQPNAAVCVLASGAALLLLAGGRRRAGVAFGVVVAFLGAGSLFQNLSGTTWDGLNTVFLFDRPWGGGSVRSPGLMGPPGSTSWTLIGAALVLLSRDPAGRARRAIAGFAVVVLSIAALSLTGYLYGADVLYTLPRMTAIAFQTSTFIVAVAVALLASIPDRSPMRWMVDPGAAGVIARRAVPLIILLPLGLGWLRVRGQAEGWFDTAFGTAVLTLVLTGLLTTMLIRGLGTIARHEAALREGERRVTETLESITDGFVTLDRAWRYVYVNREAERLLGRPRAELEGRVVWDVFPEVRDAVAGRELRRAAEGRISIGFEDFHAGMGRWFSNRAYPTPEGGFAVYFRDITDRKAAEDAARRTAERLGSLVAVITDIPWTTDAAGNFVAFQESWGRYTGQTWEQMRGVGWADALHPDDREDVQARWARACASGSLYESRGRLWHAPSGSWRHFEARATPLRDASGAVREWVGTCTDVEDQWAAHQALREADRRKDEFLASLAHELRNPLAPLQNAVQILALDGATARESAWARDVIGRQVRQMSRLIDDLMDVSRISRGRIELKPERVELARVVEGALEASRPLIDQGGHDLTVSLDPEPVWLDADITRLAQVFCNLLNNAARYSEKGGRIVLTAAREGNEAVVSVRDSGIGIPAEFLPKVFEMFLQVDHELVKAQGGLGIGLTLVKRLVDLHRGRVEARSPGPGQGSEFIVRLPVAAAPSKDGMAARGLEVRAVPDVPRRILVVDDNRDAADSLASVLRLRGHEVRIAYDGLDAVGLAADFAPEVALLDIGLPRIDGCEAARRIRRAPGGPGIVLVAVTGWGQDADVQRSKDAGFDHHLVKPVEPSAILELLASLAGLRS